MKDIENVLSHGKQEEVYHMIYESFSVLACQEYGPHILKDIFENDPDAMTPERRILTEISRQIDKPSIFNHLFDTSIHGRSTNAARTRSSEAWPITKEMYIKAFQTKYQAQMRELIIRYINSSCVNPQHSMCASISCGRFLIMESATGIKFKEILEYQNLEPSKNIESYMEYIHQIYKNEPGLVEEIKGAIVEHYAGYEFDDLIACDSMERKLKESISKIYANSNDPEHKAKANKMTSQIWKYFDNNLTHMFFDRSLSNSKIDTKDGQDSLITHIIRTNQKKPSASIDMISKGFDARISRTYPFREYIQICEDSGDENHYSKMIEYISSSDERNKIENLDAYRFAYNIRSIFFALKDKDEDNRSHHIQRLRMLEEKTTLKDIKETTQQILHVLDKAQ